MEKNWKEFVQEKYQEYKDIEYVECPAFGGERVYFTDKGFNHLIRKRKRLRPRFEQIRRLNLIPYARYILEHAKTSFEYKERIEKFLVDEILIDSQVSYWSFVEKINNERIIVIVRKINDESKHFFSIMDKI
jgi:hypothetical protein